jgi:tetratricopeptide (TPR) repeat protein
MNPMLAMAMRGATILGGVLLLASCATPPPAPVAPAGPPPLTDAQIVEATRAAGRDGVELVVTPLVDPHVEDLRERAEKAQADGKPKKADRELLKALEITPDDPDLLQWRAELAVLRQALDEAESLAKRSIALGPKSGPLCRRNWTLLKLLREARGEAENAASAAAMLERCTIAPPVRM